MRSGQPSNAPALQATAVFAVELVIWTFYRVFGGPFLYSRLLPVWASITETAIKTLLFVVPALWLLHRAGAKAPIPLRKLLTLNKKTVLWGLGLTLLFAAYYMGKMLIFNGHVGVKFELSFDDILGTVLFAGITEETFFRGYFLNMMLTKFKFLPANLLTALCFAMTHLPIWYTKGYMGSWDILWDLLSAFVIGFLLGIAAKRSESIWGSMFAHSMHNLIVTILV